ncbi:flippase-like domain-containing protein [Candidatus Woesearchaeota archaeon]|nr:flippase-like domain-containing protein [Candidatus Woesearchaeota archaeon]
MKKLMFAASVLVGAGLFVVVLLFVGFNNIVEPFKKFSPLYLSLFIAATAVLHLIATWRWATVLKYQGFKSPFLLLLRYKLIGSAISYLTPAARVGGEPVRGLLLKNKLNLRGEHAFSSVLIESSLGMTIDALFISVVLIGMLLFFTVPSQLAGLALYIAITAIFLISVFYFALIKHRGPFSSALRLLNSVIPKGYLQRLIRTVAVVEDTMVDFLNLRRKGVVQAVFVSALSWPVTFIQYKFALLSIGFDASVTIILLSIIATSIAGFIPVPAAFGIQEAGHFSVFSIVSAASIGIALSLLIRFKDLLTTLVGLILVSHEGLSILDVLRKK